MVLLASASASAAAAVAAQRAANDVAQSRHLLVEQNPLCTGWVQDAKGRDRFVVLHPSHAGEAVLVTYEREKSNSLVQNGAPCKPRTLGTHVLTH